MKTVDINSNELREGDLIFIAIPNLLYQQVAKGTGSKASHVGIILKNEKGDWIVAESAVPFSRKVSLESFLKRSKDGWYTVRRLNQPISPEQLAAIHRAADARMGVLYHQGFKFDSKRLFCSKFAYLVFKEAMGIEVGRLETFRELLARQPDTPTLFWRLWYFGFIPWERVTITPASQMTSPMLTTVQCTPELGEQPIGAL